MFKVGSKPIGIPQWKGKLHPVQAAPLRYSMAVGRGPERYSSVKRQLWKQHSCEPPWAEAPPWLDSFPLLHLTVICSAYSLLAKCLQYSNPSQETQTAIFGEKRKYMLEPQGSWFIETEVPAPGSWLVHPHANEDSKYSQFDWFENHCPDWSEYSCSDCAVRMLTQSSDRMGEVCVVLVEIDSRTSSIKPGSDSRKALQCRLLPKAMRGTCSEMAARRCFEIWAQLATRSPSW